MVSSDPATNTVPRQEKARTVRQLFAIHGWVGIGLGFVLTVICGSGAIAVFGNEIDWLLNPALRVKAQPHRASFDTILGNVRHAFPGASIVWWNLQAGPQFADEIELDPPSANDGQAAGPTCVYVNPYTGAVQGVQSPLTARRFLRAFHYYWFDTKTGLGFYLVSAFAIVLLISTYTGMAIYRRWWRGLFMLRPYKGTRIFFSDLHKFCGAWTLLFNLIISLTAVYYLVEQIAYDSGSHWEIPTPKLDAKRLAQLEPGITPLSLNKQVENARRHFPELQIANIALPQALDEPLYLDGQAAAWFVRERANKLLLDPYDGSVVFLQRAERLGPAWRWVDSVDRLHFGNFAGLASKLVWSILGLMLPVLYITGSWLGLRRSGPIEWQSIRHIRNPINILSIAATTALLFFAIFSTINGVRQAISQQPMQPRLMTPTSIVQ